VIHAAALETIGQDLDTVERALRGVSPATHPELGLLIRGLVSAGGKRLRPALVLLAARYNNYDLDRLVDGAVAVELLHTATLVHDDVLDRAAVRRGHATVNAQLPDKAAVLVGDYIFAQSAIYAARPRDPEVIAVFAQTLADICDGELRQMLGRRLPAFDREEYYSRIYAKTGALLACATEIGAILSGASLAERALLRRYGEKLGQAFQIVDDVLDFSATTEQAGKPVGSDLRQGTVTLPTIIYVQSLSGGNGQSQVVMDVLAGMEGSDAELAVSLIRDSGALEIALDVARSFAEQATVALLELPSGEARSALVDLAEYVLRRDR